MIHATPSSGPTHTLTLRSGERLTLRPVHPHDDWRLAELINAASEPARRQRFPSSEGLASPARLQALACVDQCRHVALVVTHRDAPDDAGETERIVAEARYRIDGHCNGDGNGNGDSAEFALMVDERWQRRGIGSWLLRALSAHAAHAGIARLHGEAMADHTALLALVRRCRFRVTVDPLQPRIAQFAMQLQAPLSRSAGAAFWRRFTQRRWAGAPWPPVPAGLSRS